MSRAISTHWSSEDKKVLVDYLFDHRSAIGEGGNWTKTTLSGAVGHLASTVTPAKGGPKTASAIRTQWSNMKKIHNGIREVLDGRAGSGLQYSDDHGFNIQDDNSDQVGIWEGFVQSRSFLRPFRNTPWSLFNMVDEIIPTHAKGLHVFNASQASLSTQSSGDSQDSLGLGTQPAADSQDSTAGITQPSSSSQPATDDLDDAFRFDSDLDKSDPPVPPLPIRPATPAPTRSHGKRPSTNDFDTFNNKRSRVTGPEAIMSMSKSVASIGDALLSAFGTKAGESSPEKKERAQTKLQDDNELPELTQEEKVDLHILFSHNTAAADAYFRASDNMRLAVALRLLANRP